ncbi:MAG: ABC transporter permease [Pirellulales bacterium]
MASYLIRRLLIGSLTLLLITMLIYALIRSMPGDPSMIDTEGLTRRISQEDYDLARKAYGLDKTWYLAYFEWLADVARFDFGNSFYYKLPVGDVISQRIGPTLLLSVTSLVLAYLLSIPLGLYSTARSGRTDERLLSTGLYVLYSMPAFVMALLLQSFFAVRLRDTWLGLPLLGMHSQGYDLMSPWEQTLDLFSHMVLPVFCFTYGALAYESRFIRSNMQEVIRQDYIRTARAKGVGPIRVLWHHAFRNTLIPFVTLIGLTLPALLSGAVILEQIFTWPGMGSLMFQSIGTRDYPVIMGLVLLFSIIALSGQLLADILYTVVDPRVTYS